MSIRYITLRGCREVTWLVGTLRSGDVVWVDAVATHGFDGTPHGEECLSFLPQGENPRKWKSRQSLNQGRNPQHSVASAIRGKVRRNLRQGCVVCSDGQLKKPTSVMTRTCSKPSDYLWRRKSCPATYLLARELWGASEVDTGVGPLRVKVGLESSLCRVGVDFEVRSESSQSRDGVEVLLWQPIF